MHPYAAYWDRGVSNVPDMTGAKHLLHGNDLRAVCEALQIPVPFPSLLDVGCGTGRMAQLCEVYHGADIAPAAVAYCRERNITADLISTYDELPDGPFAWASAISVCTHIGREERRELLTALQARATSLLIDIICGDGGGTVEVWTAVPAEFSEDLAACGWRELGWTDFQWDMHTHRYFRAVKA